MSNTDGLVSDSSGSDDGLGRDYLGLHRNADGAGAEPGRNILSHGVDAREGHVRSARKAGLRRSVSVPERMTAPAPQGGTVPATQAGSTDPTLAAIAACESGGDPTAVGGGGRYRGKYQFSYETWQSAGGTGDPAAAPEAEQDRRAAMLLARDGAGHWPACGG